MCTTRRSGGIDSAVRSICIEVALMAGVSSSLMDGGGCHCCRELRETFSRGARDAERGQSNGRPFGQ